jgi:hypothetical protein
MYVSFVRFLSDVNPKDIPITMNISGTSKFRNWKMYSLGFTWANIINERPKNLSVSIMPFRSVEPFALIICFFISSAKELTVVDIVTENHHVTNSI